MDDDDLVLFVVVDNQVLAALAVLGYGPAELPHQAETHTHQEGDQDGHKDDGGSDDVCLLADVHGSLSLSKALLLDKLAHFKNKILVIFHRLQQIEKNPKNSSQKAPNELGSTIFNFGNISEGMSS